MTTYHWVTIGIDILTAAGFFVPVLASVAFALRTKKNQLIEVIDALKTPNSEIYDVAVATGNKKAAKEIEKQLSVR